MRKIVPLLCFIFMMTYSAEADEMIKKGEFLNLERCIEIA
jgi:hypothetical protein